MPNAYSDTKVLWQLRRLTKLRDGSPFAPQHVQLILSDLCNEDCSFCAYRMSGYTTNQKWGEVRNPNRMIPTEKALELLQSMAECGVRAIQFTGGGEPTVHPDHLRIFEEAQALGFKTGLVTNGILLDKGLRSTPRVYQNFDWIRVSLDAATEASYAKIRNTPKANFTKAMRNLSDVAHFEKPLVGVSFCVLKDNLHEIHDAVALARGTGAAYIRFGAFFSAEEDAYYAGWHETVRELIDAARREYERPGFKVVDLFGERLADLHAHQPDYPVCGFQFFTTYIGADLNVYRCCNTAYNERGLLGSVKDQLFEDFWFSDEVQDKLRLFDPGGCERCQFNNKNRLINAVLERPVHEDFI